MTKLFVEQPLASPASANYMDGLLLHLLSLTYVTSLTALSADFLLPKFTMPCGV